jgi:alpha(1,3/1,4) fucosyltransferase
MKQIIVAPYSKVFERNEMFRPDSVYNNENRLKAGIMLKHELENSGFTVNTYDLFPASSIEKNDVYLSYNHHPGIFKQVARRISWENRILIAQEPLEKSNFIKSTIKSYGKVLTWNENILGENNVHRIKTYPITKFNVDWIPLDKRRFLTNISMNKKSAYKGELYSERINTIRLAEKLFPGEFDHWGIGWNPPKTFLEKIGLKKYIYIDSYRGALKEKYDTLRQYKFSVCYENTKDLPGNLSEKIFDCFQCGVIPLYWGAPDVLKYIPVETFIWRENFHSNEEMLLFIRSMPNDAVSSMIDTIRKFITSENMDEFWDTTYIDRIIQTIRSIAINDVQ